VVVTFATSAYQSLVSEARGFRDPVASRPALLEQLRRGETIAVAGTTEYLSLWYYAPPQVRDRLVYLADPASALDRTGTDTVDRNYLALARWAPVTVHDYRTFAGRQHTFLVYSAGPGWLIETLYASGATLDEVGREADGPIYRVTLPADRSR
jgi:hypothetical protein